MQLWNRDLCCSLYCYMNDEVKRRANVKRRLQRRCPLRVRDGLLLPLAHRRSRLRRLSRRRGRSGPFRARIAVVVCHAGYVSSEQKYRV